MKGVVQWSCAEGSDPAGAQLCEEHRVQAYFITVLYLLPSNLHPWSEGSAAVSPSGLFLLSLFLFFFLLSKLYEMASLDIKERNM